MLPNFNKSIPKPVNAQSAASVVSGAAARNDRSMSLVGPDLAINGNLFSKGELRVDGE